MERAQAQARAAAQHYEQYCDLRGCGDQAEEVPDVVGDALGDALVFWFLEGARRGFDAPAFLPQYDASVDYRLRPGMSAALPNGEVWLVATRTANAAEAIKFARASAIGFPGAQLFLDEDRTYHVVVTMLYDHEAEGVRQQLLEQRKLPLEADIDDGAGFVQRIWASDGVLRREYHAFGPMPTRD